MLLKDTCEIAADILTGLHDSNLDHIDAAVKYRKKDMFRPGSTFILKGTRNPELDGKSATVLKVNQKRIAVGVGEKIEEFPGFWTWTGGEYNVPAAMLQAAA